MKQKEKLYFIAHCLLIIILLIGLSAAISSSKTYVLTIGNSNSTIYPKSLELFDLPFNQESNSSTGRYKAEIVNEQEKILYSVKFDFTYVTLPSIKAECIDKETKEILCNISFLEGTLPFVVLNLPYLKEASMIKIYEKNKLLFTFELQHEGINLLDYKYLILAIIFFGIIAIFFLIFRKQRNNNQSLNPKESFSEP